MKKIFLSLVFVTSLVFSSCQFDDSDIWSKLNEYGESIRDHEQRISALEELCKQMNTNIEALQTIVDALEKRDYVTNVSEVRSNGEVVGYAISFANSDTVTIYHGKDGQDGIDGYTPQIGVAQDADGIYYWTLDGEWLLDSNGNKIKAVGTDGKDGANGSNGSNGTNGNDGITPRLKIENDYWYVSYDNGATWVQLGKATGEDGKNGQNSIIIGVEESETEVVFTLSDNTTITIPKHAKSSLADPDDICTAMDDVKFMEYCYKNFDVNKDGKVSPVEAKSVRNIDINGLEIYSIKGIEYFEILETLKAETTPLRNVDISFNNKLVSFSFKNCNGMTSIMLPKNITTIVSKAFYGCSKLGGSITIPDSVTSIGERAFYNCTSLTSVNYTGVLSAWCKIYFGDSDANPLCNGARLYINGVEQNDITIPSDITEIKNYTFYRCASLKSVTIPNSVTEIGSCAFYGCPGELTVNCNIPSPSASSHAYGAFYSSKFTEVTIGDSVTSIGGSAFYNCTSLTNVTIPDSVTSIGEGAFYNCSSLTSVHISDLSAWCKIEFGAVAVLGSQPLSNGAKLYLNGIELTNLAIPSDITEIKDFTFSGCISLTSITIPDNVTFIGVDAFNGCGNLTSIYCKPMAPPAIHYYRDFHSIPFNSGMQIYVPRSAYNTYMQYDSSSIIYAPDNWVYYESYIQPYDFE